MNFDDMWSVNGHSDIMFVILSSHQGPHIDLGVTRFWIIAIPVMAIVVPLFLWNDIQRLVHYMQKRMIVKRVKRVSFQLLNFTVPSQICFRV